jgi:lambda repressor-like predicted transcriptional regulator
MILHTKHDPKLNGHFIPTPKRIDAEPYARIIRELLRSGWTMRKLALRTGFSPVAIRNIALSMTTWVYPDTAAELTKLVELLPSERVELRRVGA